MDSSPPSPIDLPALPEVLRNRGVSLRRDGSRVVVTWTRDAFTRALAFIAVGFPLAFTVFAVGAMLRVLLGFATVEPPQNLPQPERPLALGTVEPRAENEGEGLYPQDLMRDPAVEASPADQQASRDSLPRFALITIAICLPAAILLHFVFYRVPTIVFEPGRALVVRRWFGWRQQRSLGHDSPFRVDRPIGTEDPSPRVVARDLGGDIALLEDEPHVVDAFAGWLNRAHRAVHAGDPGDASTE